jgi:spermidine/putrescine transport system permease protein
MKKVWDRILAGYSLALYVFLYAPILVMVVFSFNDSKLLAVWRGFSFRWYEALVADPTVWVAFYNSIWVASLTTVVSMVLGTMTAFVMIRYSFRGKSILDSALYFPVVIPEITEALSLLLFYVFTGIPLGAVTVAIGHIAFSISYATIVIRARLVGFDRSVEEAAKSLGANEFRTFVHVTLPLILPGVIAGGLLAFTVSYDDFIKTAFTAGPGFQSLPLKIYAMASRGGVSPLLNALATITLIVSLCLALVRLRLSKS